MKTIAIIGGGITGLTAAYHLQQMIRAGNLAARVVLVEAQPELGGKIHTRRESGYVMETGADSIVSRKTNVIPYLEQLGLQENVVYNATGRSFLYIDGKLKPIPEDTVFGIPLGVESLAKSELISAEGKVEALKDLYTPNEQYTVNDSVGSFLKHFLGEELVTRQIAPVLSGVYSGSLDDLTLASTMPYLLDYKNEYGSILQGLAANKQKFKHTGSGKFISFAGGLSQLIEQLADNLPDIEIRKGMKAVRLNRQGERYVIGLSDGSELTADCAILGVLHTHARDLLGDRGLDEWFGQMVTSSLISVYLGFDVSDDILPEDGTGFIVAEQKDLLCSACTWTSRKWTHTSTGKRLLVRLFYKSSSPYYETLANMTEEELLLTAGKDIERSLGITDRPVTHAVTRWQDAMPNYHVRHRAVVTRLEEEMRDRYPGVILAGCSYYGVGIPDCMQSGEQAAKLAAELVGSGSGG